MCICISALKIYMVPRFRDVKWPLTIFRIRYSSIYRRRRDDVVGCNTVKELEGDILSIDILRDSSPTTFKNIRRPVYQT